MEGRPFPERFYWAVGGLTLVLGFVLVAAAQLAFLGTSTFLIPVSQIGAVGAECARGEASLLEEEPDWEVPNRLLRSNFVYRFPPFQSGPYVLRERLSLVDLNVWTDSAKTVDLFDPEALGIDLNAPWTLMRR